MSESFLLEVDFAPAHECATSLQAYLRKANHKALESGAGWIKEMNLLLPPEVRARLGNHPEIENFDFQLFVSCCPGPRTPEAFIGWLRSLNPGELYERMASTGEAVPPNLGELRDAAADALEDWNTYCFSQVKPEILDGLNREAERVRQLISRLPADELYEQLTNGMALHPKEAGQRVLLIPQHHMRPYNNSSFYPNLAITSYPCDAVLSEADFPPPLLSRMTRALSDDSRLRILHYLRNNPEASFSEIVKHIGISKSTIHYHLVLLRAAGFVKVHVYPRSTQYSLRPSGITALTSQLSSYLQLQQDTEDRLEEKG
ncbi:ArsR family transcriptional regulator [Paenibacillus sp. MSJ-6]|uniref:ArsR family transcriptional regulator n=1 Tax=Paenibacillus brevis TaxID=2841508 RepID=A0ABS6FQR1_9BACL|nr:ArsR family transcriptional regulator [Paenibacillus brevis]